MSQAHNMPKDYTQYYITTYTKWTHDHFISLLTSRTDDPKFRQNTVSSNEAYGEILVRSTVELYNEIKRGMEDNNHGLAYNIEYAPQR